MNEKLNAWDKVQTLFKVQDRLEQYEGFRDSAWDIAKGCGQHDSCEKNAQRMDGVVAEKQFNYDFAFSYVFQKIVGFFNPTRPTLPTNIDDDFDIDPDPLDDYRQDNQ